MQNKHFGYLGSTVSALALMLASTSVNAQDSEQSSDDVEFEIDEITVIAKKFGKGLSRATFAVSNDEIEQRPLGAEITQSLNQIPGVQVSTSDSRGGSFSFEIYLRGLTDEQIGFTVDGIPTGDSRFNGGTPPNRFLESSNTSNIVVSQSAGDIGAPSRFALGGFIAFESDDPNEELSFLAEASVGSFDFQRYFFRIDTGELAPGLFAYASFSESSNDNYAGPNNRNRNRRHFDGKLLKTFDNGSTLAFRVSYNDLEDNDFNIISLPEFLENPNSDRAGDVLTGVPNIDADFGGALGGTRDDWLAYINGDFVLSDSVSLKVNPYFHSLRGESFRYQNRQSALDGGDPRAVLGYDESGGAIRPDLIRTADGDTFGGPADLRVTPRDRDRYGVSSELLFEEVADVHNIRIGGWYENSESTETRNFFPLIDSRVSLDFDASSLAFVEYDRAAEVETIFLYAQDQIELMDGRLNIDLGLTYFDVGYTATSPLEYSPTVDFNQDSGINPKVGVSFSLTDELELYGGYAQNFGGIPEDVFLGSSAVINPDDLDPVETENFDVGLRYVRDNLAISLAGFYVDLENNIGIIPNELTADTDLDDILRGNVATRAANLAGTETFGIEATLFADLGAIDLYATYAYQDAEHKDVSTEQELIALARNGIIAGERIRDIPKNSFFGEVGWEPREGIRIALNANHIGKRVGAHLLVPSFCNPFFCFDGNGAGVAADQALGIQELDAYTLVGFTAKYTPDTGTFWDNLTLQLNIDNLFEENFVSAVSGATATLPEFGVIGGQGTTLDRYFIGYPRTVTFSAKMSF